VGRINVSFGYTSVIGPPRARSVIVTCAISEYSPMPNDAGPGSTARKPSRAAVLLKKVVATGSIEHGELARVLVVTEETLDLYLADSLAIPLDRQLCLALFVIERVPQLARAAHQLRAQVGAALAYDARETTIHMSQPPRAGW